MDASIELKDKVLKYVNDADARLLKMIQALVESYQSTEDLSQEVKDELDSRLKIYEENSGQLLNWNEEKENW